MQNRPLEKSGKKKNGSIYSNPLVELMLQQEHQFGKPAAGNS